MPPCVTWNLLARPRPHVPEAVRSANAHIPWRLIVATRNRLIHGYLGLDDDTLWSSIRDDVPELLPLLKALKDEAQP